LWEYINRSQIYECRNWERGRAVFLSEKITKRDNEMDRRENRETIKDNGKRLEEERVLSPE
jgi:hypothetical protein